MNAPIPEDLQVWYGGAWYGVGRFSGAWLWGLTHTRCRQCGGPKKRECCPNCARCALNNLRKALEEEP